MSIVREFHEAFGHPAPKQPHPGSAALLRLRMKLIREEYEEVKKDLSMLIWLMEHHEPGRERVDKIHGTLGSLLKELADLRYVTEGAAVALGMDIEGAYSEVHRSNMSKLGTDGKPVLREDGKVLKGPNYSEADMGPFVPPIIEVDPEEVTTHEHPDA